MTITKLSSFFKTYWPIFLLFLAIGGWPMALEFARSAATGTPMDLSVSTREKTAAKAEIQQIKSTLEAVYSNSVSTEIRLGRIERSMKAMWTVNYEATAWEDAARELRNISPTWRGPNPRAILREYREIE